MRQLSNKLRPTSGFAHYFHIGLTSLIPILVFIFVLNDFALLALATILLSKWRIFAVRPRYWLTNIRANAIDILFGVAMLVFMLQTDTTAWLLLWVVVYEAWIIFIKPGSSTWLISLQAGLGQLAALMALFTFYGDKPLYWLVLGSWFICYIAARHYLSGFDEGRVGLIAACWGYFGGALTWVLGHWLLFYAEVAQIILIISAIGYGLAALYYFHDRDRLSSLLQRQFIFIMAVIVAVVFLLSDWTIKQT